MCCCKCLSKICKILLTTILILIVLAIIIAIIVIVVALKGTKTLQNLFTQLAREGENFRFAAFMDEVSTWNSECIINPPLEVGADYYNIQYHGDWTMNDKETLGFWLEPLDDSKSVLVLDWSTDQGGMHEDGEWQFSTDYRCKDDDYDWIFGGHLSEELYEYCKRESSNVLRMKLDRFHGNLLAKIKNVPDWLCVKIDDTLDVKSFLDTVAKCIKWISKDAANAITTLSEINVYLPSVGVGGADDCFLDPAWEPPTEASN